MKRSLGLMNLAVFVLSTLAIAAAVNVLGQRPELRWRIDATKTRAYSLSDQTRNLLGQLQGEWTIALVMIQSETDRAVRRQIDEVLTRFTEAAPSLSIVRVDPTDPRTLSSYEKVLQDLQSRYSDTVDAYDANLDAGEAAYRDVMVFAQQQAGMIDQLVQIAQVNDGFDAQAYEPILQRAKSLGLIGDQGGAVLQEVQQARSITDSRPIADYETARSIMVQALATAANEVYETAEALARWVQDESLSTELRSYAAANRTEMQRTSQTLANVVDPLRHLPPLELSSIGQQLSTGEAAIILSPDRAAVISSNQLFPRSNVRTAASGVVTFDQRFRGETLLAAAMRSLLVEHMPMVVFVHAEQGSWLRQRERQVDLFGATAMLRAARFEVHEWNVAASDRDATNTQRPTPKPGQPVVWVPIPPPQRTGIEPSRDELQLIQQIRELLADGESVLVSVYPSMLPRYGQVDPWATLGRPFGVQIDTGRVIYERVRTGADESQVQRSQHIQRFESEHAIARAVHGQSTHLSLPTVIQPVDTLPDGVRQTAIATVPPDDQRWLESNWSADPATLRLDPEQVLQEPRPVVMAVNRPHPIERSQQRVLFVGSGGWMLTYIADAVTGLGGERYALDNPGNHELMLASVAWLAGMDELIAQSPTGQEVARLDEIDESTRARWFWLVVVVMPAGCLGLGMFVWGVRRR